MMYLHLIEHELLVGVNVVDVDYYNTVGRNIEFDSMLSA